jgi:hypothetical protein
MSSYYIYLPQDIAGGPMFNRTIANVTSTEVRLGLPMSSYRQVHGKCTRAVNTLMYLI